ncbi:DoxX family protein [Nonomuraea sp. NPDC050328]|uniref:DoxX family protein n=1 Tax=Nonomuraea sp. NPDC050328 TaxID=3364361 RepID=UPI0037A8BCA7
METAAVTLSVILAISFLGSGAMKLFGQAKVVAGLKELGVSRQMTAVIGALELAASAGLLIGIAVRWLGVAAAGGLVLLMIGAVVTHVRAGDYGDPKRRPPALMPVFLVVFSAVTLALLLTTL